MLVSFWTLPAPHSFILLWISVSITNCSLLQLSVYCFAFILILKLLSFLKRLCYLIRYAVTITKLIFAVIRTIYSSSFAFLSWWPSHVWGNDQTGWCGKLNLWCKWLSKWIKLNLPKIQCMYIHSLCTVTQPDLCSFSVCLGGIKKGNDTREYVPFLAVWGGITSDYSAIFSLSSPKHNRVEKRRAHDKVVMRA